MASGVALQKAMKRGRPPLWLPLGAILLLAFALRVFGLDFTGLTSDEASFTRIAYQNVIMQAVFGPEEPHPPLYLYLLHAWMGAAGVTEYGIRFLSILPGMATVAGVYVLGRQLLGRGLGLTAAFLLAINPYAVLYSQTARDYAQALCFGLLSFVLFLKALQQPRLVPGYVLAALLAIFSHYYAVAIVLLEQVILLGWLLGWWLPRARHVRFWPAWRRWLAADAAIAALFLPWVAAVYSQLVSYNRGGGTLQIAWNTLRETFQWFNVGPAFRTADAFGPSVGIALLFLIGLAGLSFRTRGRPGAIALGYLFAPVLLGLISLLHQSQFGARFLLVGIPGYVLLIGGGIVMLGRLTPMLGVVALLFMAGLGGWSFRNTVLTDEFVTNGYRPLAAYLADHAQPGDTIVLDGVSQWPQYWYYAQLRHGLRQRVEFMPRGNGQVDLPRTEHDLRDLAATSSGFWFIDSDALRYDPKLDVERLLAQNWFQAYAHNFIFQRLQYYGLQPIGPSQAVQPSHFDGFDLVAASKPAAPVAAGRPLGISLTWQSTRAAPPAFKVSLRLETAGGQPVAQNDSAVQGGFFRSNDWKKGQRIQDDHGLTVPVGTPPGSYVLRLLPYDAATGKPLGQPLELAAVSVDHSQPQQLTAAGLPPIGRQIGAQRLVAGALDQGSAASGDRVGLTLLWAGGPTASPTRVPVTIGGQTSEHVVGGDSYPTTQWQAEDVVRDHLILRLPGTLPAGSYPVAVAGVPLGQLRVTPGNHSFAKPAVPTPREARFGDLAELLGYGYTLDGSSLDLRLYWHVLNETDVSYKIFVHVLGQDGQIAGQVDKAPGTDRWVSGEYLVTAYHVPLRAASGTVAVEIGLYQEASGKRLPVGSGDSLVLTTLER